MKQKDVKKKTENKQTKETNTKRNLASSSRLANITFKHVVWCAFASITASQVAAKTDVVDRDISSI